MSKAPGGYKVTGIGACSFHRLQSAAVREGRRRAKGYKGKAELFVHHRGGGMTRSSYKKDPYLPRG